jgi:hypothetical protein
LSTFVEGFLVDAEGIDPEDTLSIPKTQTSKSYCKVWGYEDGVSGDGDGFGIDWLPPLV